LGSFRESTLCSRLLSEAHSCTATVLVDELDAGGLKRLPKHRERRLTRLAHPTLEKPNRGDADTSSASEFLLSPI
jgi:hypothetical protein